MFSDETIQAVRSTWNKIETDGSTIGVAIFTRLFKDYPTYQSYFEKLRDVPYDSLKSHKTFIKHVSAVEKKLHFAIENLDNPDGLIAELLAIGKRHIKYQLTETQFRNVQLIIEDVLKTVIGDDYNELIRQSWNEVLSAAIGVIVKGATETS